MAKPSYPVILASTSLTSGIIAAWPLNEGSGNAVDVVGGAIVDCSGTGVSWNASPLGLQTIGTPSIATVATPAYMKIYPSTQPEMTLLWAGQILGTYQDYGGCCGVGSSTVDSYIIKAKTSTGGHALYGCSNGYRDGTASFVSGAAHQIVMRQTVGVLGGSFDGSGDNGTTSNNKSSGITYGSGSFVFFGSSVGSSFQSNFRHDLMVVWNRSISDVERTAMNSDPWQIFVPAPSGANPAALLPAM